MKFTFKTEKSKGRYSSFYPDIHIIKLNKKQVGNITEDAPFKISLMITKKDINEDGNPNCSWKWVVLKQESNSLQEAKEYLNNNIERITALNLHQLD